MKIQITVTTLDDVINFFTVERHAEFCSQLNKEQISTEMVKEWNEKGYIKYTLENGTVRFILLNSIKYLDFNEVKDDNK